MGCVRGHARAILRQGPELGVERGGDCADVRGRRRGVTHEPNIIIADVIPSEIHGDHDHIRVLIRGVIRNKGVAYASHASRQGVGGDAARFAGTG